MRHLHRDYLCLLSHPALADLRRYVNGLDGADEGVQVGSITVVVATLQHLTGGRAGPRAFPSARSYPGGGGDNGRERPGENSTALTVAGYFGSYLAAAPSPTSNESPGARQRRR